MEYAFDQLVFSPSDVDLSRSPLRASISVPTYVLGAFNPALTRLPNGNLLMVARIADARISLIDGVYYMTTCSVSAERHSTTLYTSIDGLNYAPQGIVLDHQNKDMVYFEGTVNGKFYALTRPLGDLYFSYPPQSNF